MISYMLYSFSDQNEIVLKVVRDFKKIFKDDNNKRRLAVVERFVVLYRTVDYEVLRSKFQSRPHVWLLTLAENYKKQLTVKEYLTVRRFCLDCKDMDILFRTVQVKNENKNVTLKGLCEHEL